MKIAITGATGQLGRLVVEKLKEQIGAKDIIALVRDTEKAQSLGVEVRAFDYNQPTGLAAALEGIDRLLLISANEIGKRTAQHQSVINAAKVAGVKFLAYTSLLRADQSTLNLAEEHLATENLIKDSGLEFTILRNGWYTENYTGSITGSLAAGAYIGSAAEGKIASASRADFADAAVAILTGEGHKGKTYELAGDQAYTLADLASEVSKQSGKNIPYHNLSEQEYSETLIKFGVPDAFAPMIASWDVAASRGDLYSDDKTLSQLIGHPTTLLSETVKTELAANS